MIRRLGGECKVLQSRWSPLKYLCQVGGLSGIPRVPHGPSGFHLDFTWIPCGIGQ
jgi:hypothetical protein